MHLAVCLPGVGNIKVGVRKDRNEKKIVWLPGVLVGNNRNLTRERSSRHE